MNEVRMERFPEIETENYYLRECDEGDSNALLNILSDEDVTKYSNIKPVNDVKDVNNLLNNFKKEYYDERAIIWSICNKKYDNEVIGLFRCYDMDLEQRRARIKFELDKKFWKQGVMTEVLKTAIPYGFNSFNFNRIDALVDIGNSASMGLLLKCGFKTEGVLRQYEYIGDRLSDIVIFSILKREWKRQQNK